VDGGGGVDTLKLDGAELTLDLTKISIFAASPLITKPPVGLLALVISLRLTTLPLALPNTT
jgi:hypothetical protein